MGIAEEIQGEAFKQQVRQQVMLLKKANKLQIVKHVEGRAVQVEFQYDGNFFGMVVLKGDKYRLFKEIGGFKDLTVEEQLEDESEEMQVPKPEVKKEVVVDGKTEQAGQSEKADV